MTFDTFFIDFDGTICFDHFWRSLPARENQAVKELLFYKNNIFLDEWMLGKRSSEEINDFVSKNTNISYDRLWKIFVKDCETMCIDERIVENIKKLSAFTNLFLVTDNMDCFNRYTLPNLKIKKFFKGIINSYDYGYLKSEENGSLYKLISENYDINLAKTCLIDNSEENCNIFKNIGGNFHYVNEKNSFLKVSNDLLSKYKSKKNH